MSVALGRRFSAAARGRGPFATARRRKPKSKSAPRAYGCSDGDRLRVPGARFGVEKGSAPPGPEDESMTDADLLRERAVTRLTWLRDAASEALLGKRGVAELRRDLRGESEGAPTSGSARNNLPPPAVRLYSATPGTRQLVMDVNWWFWNVLFALTPGTVAWIYLRFFVRPERIRELDEKRARERAEMGLPPLEEEPPFFDIDGFKAAAMGLWRTWRGGDEVETVRSGEEHDDAPRDDEAEPSNEVADAPLTLEEIRNLQRQLREMERKLIKPEQTRIRDRVEERHRATIRRRIEGEERRSGDDDANPLAYVRRLVFGDDEEARERGDDESSHPRAYVRRLVFGGDAADEGARAEKNEESKDRPPKSNEGSKEQRQEVQQAVESAVEETEKAPKGGVRIQKVPTDGAKGKTEDDVRVPRTDPVAELHPKKRWWQFRSAKPAPEEPSPEDAQSAT